MTTSKKQASDEKNLAKGREAKADHGHAKQARGHEFKGEAPATAERETKSAAREDDHRKGETREEMIHRHHVEGGHKAAETRKEHGTDGHNAKAYREEHAHDGSHSSPKADGRKHTNR